MASSSTSLSKGSKGNTIRHYNVSGANTTTVQASNA
jgi:hypothetical protein